MNKNRMVSYNAHIIYYFYYKTHFAPIGEFPSLQPTPLDYDYIPPVREPRKTSGPAACTSNSRYSLSHTKLMLTSKMNNLLTKSDRQKRTLNLGYTSKETYIFRSGYVH